MIYLLALYFIGTPFAYVVTINEYMLNKLYDEPAQKSALNVLLTPLWPLMLFVLIWRLINDARGL